MKVWITYYGRKELFRHYSKKEAVDNLLQYTSARFHSTLLNCDSYIDGSGKWYMITEEREAHNHG